MRIAILTFNTAINYGALLQSYALQQTLIDMGYNALHIKTSLPTTNKKLKNRIKHCLESKKYAGYQEFMEKELVFQDGLFDVENGDSLNDMFDVFISGSDQVWNMSHGIDPMFFQVPIDEKKRKITYAASMGIKNVPKEFLSETIRAIERFDYISVREEDAKSELEKYTNKHIECHLDPVFLLDRQKWLQLAGDRIIKKPYIFVYGTEMTQKLKKAAYDLAKEKGLPLISVFPMAKSEVVDWKTGPKEFLNYIANAEYVVTSSFHATAFSIIFHKQLLEILHSTTSSRSENLLQKFGLTDCIYAEDGRIEQLDYSQADKVLEKEKEKAVEYLTRAIDLPPSDTLPPKTYREIWTDAIAQDEVISNVIINCTACGLCQNICPAKAIKMIRRDSGFFYPSIDPTICIHCNLCHNNCPATKDTERNNNILNIYAAKSKDENTLRKCSSGGVFVHLSDWILNHNGVVYGCRFDQEFNAVIDRAETKEQRDAFCGSKYIQSNAGLSYMCVEKDLKEGRIVLFSGVPCQIHALNTYLKAKKIDTEMLFTVDLICHGSPNPTLWQKHLKKITQKCGNSKIRNVTFRRKDSLGNGQCLSIEFENGKTYFSRSGHDEYYRMFLNNYTLRPSCYSCRYTSTKRESDITLGDWWGGIR